MEYKLNKIDTALRQSINEERSEDKIHNKKGILVNKDKNKDTDKWDKLKKKNISKGRSVNAGDVDAFKETPEPDKGHYIDIRR